MYVPSTRFRVAGWYAHGILGWIHPSLLIIFTLACYCFQTGPLKLVSSKMEWSVWKTLCDYSLVRCNLVSIGADHPTGDMTSPAQAPIPFIYLKNNLSLLFIFGWGHRGAVYGNQRITCQNWFSLSYTWVPGIELRFVRSDFTLNNLAGPFFVCLFWFYSLSYCQLTYYMLALFHLLPFFLDLGPF